MGYWCNCSYNPAYRLMLYIGSDEEFSETERYELHYGNWKKIIDAKTDGEAREKAEEIINHYD